MRARIMAAWNGCILLLAIVFVIILMIVVSCEQGFRLQPTSAQEGSPAPTAVTPISGLQPMLTILCRFKDSTNQFLSSTRGTIETLMGDRPPGLAHYFNEVSGGKLQLASTVTGWHNLPEPQGAYLQNGRINWEKSLVDCTEAARRDGVAIDSFNIFNLVFSDPVGSSAFGGRGALRNQKGEWRSVSVTWLSQWYSQQDLVAHELGHALAGWPHSLSGYDLMNGFRLTCSSVPEELQGFGCPGIHTIAFYKYLVGWLETSQVFTANFGTDTTLELNLLGSPTANGTLLIIIPVAGEPTTRFLTAEARCFNGSYEYPGGLPGCGVILHSIDSTLPNGILARVVDEDSDLDLTDEETRFTVGKVFRHPAGIMLEVLEQTDSGFRVRIVNRGIPPAYLYYFPKITKYTPPEVWWQSP